MKRIYNSDMPEKQDAESQWSELLEDLRSDFDQYISDPLYEQTPAGSFVLDLCYSAEREMGIYLEPSVQGGQGGIWIYDENGSLVADDIDYADFNNAILDLVFEVKNSTEFINKYKEMLQDEIDFYADTH